ncbi:unnamed protein product [Chondrus crispus]|uniref:Uncharacterized protein n=1 Tax=Chondrus crispus TaxID=2769 RepID=R7Q9L0_CHOCR|nr:unnamed protein product [Chondrus crispus]CDF34165.1 unnamed protein product [Chondrus crispus]|eukprot:XP_005713984.1 unnamed protein product [Chondrus crispus]
MLEARQIARDHYTNRYQKSLPGGDSSKCVRVFERSLVQCSLITEGILAIRGTGFGSYSSTNGVLKWQRHYFGKPMTAGVFPFCLPNSSNSSDCSISQSFRAVRMLIAISIRCSTK